MIDHSPYNNMEIPSQLSSVVADALACGQGKRRHKLRLLRLIAWVPVSVAACLVLLLNLSPTFAQGVCSLPVVGEVCRIFIFREYHSENQFQYIDAVIPQIENTGKTELEQRVNEYLQQLIENCLEESGARAKEYYDAFVTTGGDPEEFRPVGVNIDYDVKYISPQYVSLHISHYETSFTAYQTDYYYTVDLDGEQVLTLKDWFGDDYQQIVANSIRTSISQWSQEQQQQLFPNLDLESLITEDRSFYLNEQGQVVVVFDKYELACGAAGRPEFVITQ